MINTVVGRNIEVTDALRETIDKKLSKLDKYFHKEMESTVTLIVEKNRQIVEVMVPLSGRIIRAEESTDDMYASIDKVIDVLEKQIRKQKERLKDKKFNGETIRFENIEPVSEEEEGKIKRVKKFSIKPMSEEEAVLQMELIGHDFFVFRNWETEEINVVYKRKDGHYGLIVPEN